MAGEGAIAGATATTGGAAPAGGATPSGGGAEKPVAGTPPVRRAPVVTHKGATPDAKAAGAPGAHSGSATTPPAQGKADATKPPAKPVNPDFYKKLELKLGPDDTETLEFDTPDQLVDRLRRERAQNKAWQQKHSAIEARSKALEAAGKDPLAAAKALDPKFDPDAFAMQRARELYEADLAKQQDPQGWEIQQRDAKIAEYERKEQAAQKKSLEEADRSTKEANRKRWQERIIEAIDEVAVNEGGEPEDADYKASVLLPAVAGVLFHARQQNPTGDPDLELTPREVAQAVRKQHGRTFDRGLERAPLAKVLPQALKHLGTADDAGLLGHLGPELVARIVKAHLDSTNPGNIPRAPPPSRDEPVVGDEGERRRTLSIGERRTIPRL